MIERRKPTIIERLRGIRSYLIGAAFAGIAAYFGGVVANIAPGPDEIANAVELAVTPVCSEVLQNPGRFKVLLTRLGDDQETQHKHISRALELLPYVEFLTSRHSIVVEEGIPHSRSVEAAHETALAWARECGVDLVIWGEAVINDRTLQVRFSNAASAEAQFPFQVQEAALLSLEADRLTGNFLAIFDSHVFSFFAQKTRALMKKIFDDPEVGSQELFTEFQALVQTQRTLVNRMGTDHPQLYYSGLVFTTIMSMISLYAVDMNEVRASQFQRASRGYIQSALSQFRDEFHPPFFMASCILDLAIWGKTENRGDRENLVASGLQSCEKANAGFENLSKTDRFHLQKTHSMLQLIDIEERLEREELDDIDIAYQSAAKDWDRVKETAPESWNRSREAAFFRHLSRRLGDEVMLLRFEEEK